MNKPTRKQITDWQATLAATVTGLICEAEVEQNKLVREQLMWDIDTLGALSVFLNALKKEASS